MLSLRAAVYFEYVPSKANIADLPSRRAYLQLMLELQGLPQRPAPDVLKVPSVAQWARPLSSWAVPNSVAASVQFPV